MKLASFHAEGKDRFGFTLDGTTLFDLTDSGDAFQSLLDLIEGGLDASRRVKALAEEVRHNPRRLRAFAAGSIAWHPPVRRPSKICCIALNNSANPGRIKKGPNHPAIFLKPPSSLVGHEGAIECKPNYGRVHPEPELAVVIGKRARRILENESLDHVFGYSIFNDITSPDMRIEDTFQYGAIHPKDGDPSKVDYVDSFVSYSGRYKGSDTFACMGPFLVTKDEISDPHDLTVQCHHKGRLITEDNTVNLLYKTSRVVSFISHYMTLEPGDIVSLGTALKQSASGGAIQNIDLNRVGGPVSVTITGLGTLNNSVTHLED